MRIYSWDDINEAPGVVRTMPEAGKGTALTVGSFDGPHRGHQVLFDAVLQEAAESGYVPGVVSFAVPALAAKTGAAFPGLIATLDERLQRYERAGFAFAVVIDFSTDFRLLSGEAFVSCLYRQCGMRFLAEGADFRCGHRGATGTAELTRLAAESAALDGIGFRLRVLPPVLYAGQKISSSRIREAIVAGNIDDAAAMLGYPAPAALIRVTHNA